MFKGLGRKLAIIICVFSVALSAAIGFIGYRTYMKSVLARYESFAAAIVRMAHSYIDAEDMKDCFERGEKSEAYEKTQTVLNNIKETTNITYLYFFRMNGDKMAYYLNSFTKDESESGYVNSLGDEDDVPDGFAEQLKNIGGTVVIANNSEYGYMLSVYEPVRDSNGEIIGILGADIDMLEINSTMRSYIITVMVGAISIMSLFTFLALTYLQKKIINPIRQLSEGAANFVRHSSRQDALTPLISNIQTNDEIETLSKSIEKMTADLIMYIDNLTKTLIAKERIESELSVATQIQASMLPCIFPPFPDRKEFDIFATMLPAKEVGGDFYDFFLVDESKLAVVIADVSGKGVPAALFMVIAKTLIKNNASLGKSPKEVFEAVNSTLCENNEAGMFVTAFMGYLDIQAGSFVYVNAGHNPPLIKRACGSYEFLKTKPCFVLAGFDGVAYREEEISFAPGDALYLYTDGVTEAMNISKELFSDPRLLSTINKYKDSSLKEQLAGIKKEIDDFVGDAEQADDITMLALKVI